MASAVKGIIAVLKQRRVSLLDKLFLHKFPRSTVMFPVLNKKTFHVYKFTHEFVKTCRMQTCQRTLALAGFLRVIKYLESHAIFSFRFSGLERHGF